PRASLSRRRPGRRSRPPRRRPPRRRRRRSGSARSSPGPPLRCRETARSANDGRSSRGGLEQSLRVAKSRFRNLLAGQHPRDLAPALLPLEEPPRRNRAPFRPPLLRPEVTIRERRDLRHVRHAQHLVALRELAELLSDDLGDASADAGVHLVENE